MLVILTGLIAYAGVVVIEHLLSFFLNISLSGFSVLIIPVGAIAVAYAMARFIVWGCRFGRKRRVKLVLIVALFVGILTYPTIRYTEYRIVCQAEEYVAERDHMEYKAKWQSFFEYEDAVLDSEGIRFGKRGQIEVDTPYGYNLAVHILIMLAYAITLPFSAYAEIKGASYCEKCRRFHHKHSLKNLKGAHAPTADNLHDQGWLNNNIAYLRMSNIYYKAQLEYCPTCQTGTLSLQHFERFNGSFKHVESKDRSISITEGKDIWCKFKVARTANFLKKPEGFHNFFWLLLLALPIFPLLLTAAFFDKQVALLLIGELTLNGMLFFLAAAFVYGYCVYCCHALIHHLLFLTGWKFRRSPRTFCLIMSFLLSILVMGAGAIFIWHLHRNGVF